VPHTCMCTYTQLLPAGDDIPSLSATRDGFKRDSYNVGMYMAKWCLFSRPTPSSAWVPDNRITIWTAVVTVNTSSWTANPQIHPSQDFLFMLNGDGPCFSEYSNVHALGISHNAPSYLNNPPPSPHTLSAYSPLN
jgi:hypothetical protein